VNPLLKIRYVLSVSAVDAHTCLVLYRDTILHTPVELTTNIPGCYTIAKIIPLNKTNNKVVKVI